MSDKMRRLVAAHAIGSLAKKRGMDGMQYVQEAMTVLWKKVGIDINSAEIDDVNPQKITVSRKRMDEIGAEIREEFPLIKTEYRLEWTLAFVQYAPIVDPDQEEDVKIEEGAVTYVGLYAPKDGGTKGTNEGQQAGTDLDAGEAE